MLTRVVTAVVAGAISLAALLAPNPIFFLAWCTVVATVCAIELKSGGTALPVPANIGIALLVGALAFLCLTAAPWNPLGTALKVTILALLFWRELALARGPIVWPACIGLSLACVASMRLLESPLPQGYLVFSAVFIAWIPLWAGDTAAYTVGKSIGKHKLAPAISPNKTWEGAVANLILCLAVAVGLSIWMEQGPLVGLAVGLTTGVLGQIGDLLQSSWKRRSGTKDSGGLLPGHGGVLDRLDSLLFSAPFSMTALLALGTWA